MTRNRLRLAGIVLIAVAVYTALIAVMVEGNRSQVGVLVMFGVILVAAITSLWMGRPLTMVTAIVGILVYTFIVGAATNVVWGREEDPFGPQCEGQWMNLIMDERCDGGLGPDGHDRSP